MFDDVPSEDMFEGNSKQGQMVRSVSDCLVGMAEGQTHSLASNKSMWDRKAGDSFDMAKEEGTIN